MKIPFLDQQQMVEVDRAMIEDYHIELIQMMENAGRNLAHLARSRFFNGNSVGKTIVVLAGTGGNGGGALVCARHLNNWGVQVLVVITREDEKFTPVAAHQLDIIRQMKIPFVNPQHLSSIKSPDLIIDGLIGYSLKGAPVGTAADLIQWANAQSAPILSLDVPSGLDSTKGTAYDPGINATATMTLALPKQGLKTPAAKTLVGELYVADISVPPALYAEPSLGLTVGPLFAESEVIRLW